VLLESCIRDGAARLAAAQVEEPRREARLLLAHAIGVSPDTLIGFSEQSIGDPSHYLKLVEKRAAHLPYSRIVGRREFWSLDFQLTEHTFDPRPDSEVVVRAALRCIPNRAAALRIADMGTGTGCLLLALLSELRNSTGVGVDRNPATAAGATINAKNLELATRADFIAGDWGAALASQFDVIVTNPPYISTSEIRELAPDVRLHEPVLALDGGADGLEAYRTVAPDLARLLVSGGIAVVEVGIAQAASVQGILNAVGLTVANVERDLSGVERCIVCSRT
jgi:release factor glutamine methyltransferase